MKKILSVLLALLMLLSSATLMVSATTQDGPVEPETPVKVGTGTSGHLFYSESFDDEALADKKILI